MCKKKVFEYSNTQEDETMEESYDSDVSITDSESEVSEEDNEFITSINLHNTESDSDIDETVHEEEDEIIKAIRRECNRERDHPPPIYCEDFITDISFHPNNNLIAASNIVGDVLLFKYSNEENILMNTFELHTKSCRDVEFSLDGEILFSASRDKSIMITNVESGKLIRFYEKSHEEAIYKLAVIDENLFSTGDDDGTIKIWDLRERSSDHPIYKTKKNEDFISDMITSESKKFLFCSSGDGSLTTIDLHNRKIHMQTEEYDEQLICLGLFRSETKLVSGTSKGKLFMFNWEEFGLHSDAFPGPKRPINALIPITENIVVTACEDGNLRATHLFPHRHLGIVGQHNFPVENVDISNTGEFIASSSHSNDIKFWNIQYFEDFEKISHKHNKHNSKNELKNNLPSSKIKNAADFFSDLC